MTAMIMSHRLRVRKMTLVGDSPMAGPVRAVPTTPTALMAATVMAAGAHQADRMTDIGVSRGREGARLTGPGRTVAPGGRSRGAGGMHMTGTRPGGAHMTGTRPGGAHTTGTRPGSAHGCCGGVR